MGGKYVSSIPLKDRLDRLLAESITSARNREENDLERKIGSLDGDFILFGAGNLGRRVLKTLKRNGRAPVAFIDNNPSLWDKKVDGVPIMSPAAAAASFDVRKVGVITTIWCGEATDR